MIILITGTSSGIGRALALGYLEAGHQVWGISRKPNADLEKYDTFRFLQQDISEFEDLKVKLTGFLRGTEQMDLLLLNAGILPRIKDLGETGLEEISRVMDVNVWANKIIIDTLFESGCQVKQVVAISSGAAISAARGWNAYSLSKATLNMLINLYSKEHTETHFSALAPGIINTGMQEYIRELPGGDRFPVVRRLREMYSKSGMPGPEEAAVSLMQSIERVKEVESGRYTDVRDMNV